jgi:hypothetical protein
LRTFRTFVLSCPLSFSGRRAGHFRTWTSPLYRGCPVPSVHPFRGKRPTARRAARHIGRRFICDKSIGDRLPRSRRTRWGVFERSVECLSLGVASTVFAFGVGDTAFSDHVPLDEVCLYLFGRDCFDVCPLAISIVSAWLSSIATMASRNTRFPRPTRFAFAFAFGGAADVGIISGATM